METSAEAGYRPRTAPISERTIERAVEVFGQHVLYQLYGQSEAVPITMLLPHEHRDRPD